MNKKIIVALLLLVSIAAINACSIFQLYNLSPSVIYINSTGQWFYEVEGRWANKYLLTSTKIPPYSYGGNQNMWFDKLSDVRDDFQLSWKDEQGISHSNTIKFKRNDFPNFKGEGAEYNLTLEFLPNNQIKYYIETGSTARSQQKSEEYNALKKQQREEIKIFELARTKEIEELLIANH